LFYCHQGILSQTGQAKFNDLYIVYHDGEFSFVPAGIRSYFVTNAGSGNTANTEIFNGRGIEDVFGDQWIWPYNFFNQSALHASVCLGLSGAQLTQCKADSDDFIRNVNYFIAPAASPPYEFGVGYDVVLPIDREWDWDLSETVKFAPNTSLVIEGALESDGISLAAADDSLGWGGLRFEPSSEGTLTNTTISGVGEDCPGGGFCPLGYSVYIDDASPVFSGVDIVDSGGDGLVHGVYVRGLTSFPRFESQTTVRDQSGDGVVLASRAQALFKEAFIQDNGEDGISAGFNTRAYLRETTIAENDGEGAVARNGGEILFGEPGGPFGTTDGYNFVLSNGGFGLRAKTNSTVRAGDLATTRYSNINLNDVGTVRAQGSSAVAYLDLNYWGGGEPTFSEASGGQTFANSYCTQPPAVDQGCPSLPFGTSNSRTRGSQGSNSQYAILRTTAPYTAARRTGREGDSTALEALAQASTLAAQGQSDAAFSAFQSLIARYPADPSAGAAFGEIGRLFRSGTIPGALDFLEDETKSQEVLHRLWAWEALARSHDALGRSDAALAAATNLDAEVKTSLTALDRTEFGQAQRLDWQIAGGVVRYYVLLREERWAEAEAELGVLSVLAPGHSVVEAMYAEASEAGLRLGGDAVRGTAPVVPEQPLSKTRGAVEQTMLGAVYPNPANAQVTVPLLLTETAEVRVTVYDMLGREVAVLADRSRQAGRHALTLDTGVLAPGVYVVHATVGNAAAQTQRFSIVR
ncbi:MAG: T9SS type A sorting domain-containing protein, partial [Bacteroidota bacterium]